MGMIDDLAHAFDEQYQARTYCPERGLLAGLLHRAVTDLRPDTPPQHRASSVGWFKTRFLPPTEKQPDNYITFQQVVSGLELKPEHVKILMKWVDEAEEYERERRISERCGTVCAEEEEEFPS